jgi:anti-sigma regulatory factor (Ser/Thr protein kinase)
MTELAPLRREVRSFLRCVGADAPLDDVLLILSELCANAVEATAAAPASIGVRIDAQSDEVTIEVDDPGPGFSLDERLSHGAPSPLAERGRGLVIVRALADDLTVQRRDGHTIVRSTVAMARPSRRATRR